MSLSIFQNQIKALECYSKGVDLGNPDCMYVLALHKLSIGEESTAVGLLQNAALQNHAESICRLGVCFMNGEHVQKDPSKAVELYRRAAEELNHANSQFKLVNPL
jgi:hypothetical protein